MGRLLTGWLVLAGGVVVLGCTVAKAAEENGAESRKIIARVNDQPIYEDQLRPALTKTLDDLRKRGMRKNDPAMTKRLQERLLEQAIGDILVNQEAKKRTIENMEQKVDQRVKELELKPPGDPGLEMYLKMRRMTMADLRESLKARVRIDEYLKEQGILEPEIPEERIREMYDSDPQSFSTREKATVSHILIGVDPHASAADKTKAREKAEQIRKEILDGKDFAELAKQHSTCQKSASAGGDLGSISPGYMPKEFDTVAFALEKGAVSEVVETRHGFHVIKLIDKEPSRQAPYDENMRAFLRKYLQEEESKKRLPAHQAELRKKAKIEILLK